MKNTLLKTALSTALLLFISLNNIAAEPYPDCSATPSVHCGSAPSAAFDEAGRLWVAFVQDQHVYVSYSDDGGQQYSPPVAVNPQPEDAEHNGENRPKIIADKNGLLYLSWTLKTSPRFTGEIRFSRSTDGGRSFEAPRTINDDGLFAGHRFESLFLTESGHLYLTWIDKRDLEAHLAQQQPYAGAAIYYAVSQDQGASFSKNYRVADHSCECCRIAVAPQGPENIAILWRQIFDGTTRDHAIAVLTPEGEASESHRASYDEWQIDACPHHGPTLVEAATPNNYHMSWFSNGDLHKGLYYGRFSFDSLLPQNVVSIDGNPGAGHPFLAEFREVVFLLWKAFDGQQSKINLMRSHDDGVSWSSPETLLTTSQGSDYPLIVSSPSGTYLSWKSDEHGYVFKRLESNAEDQSSE